MKLSLTLKLLLACLISALAPLGLAMWLVATPGWGSAGIVRPLSLFAILAGAVVPFDTTVSGRAANSGLLVIETYRIGEVLGLPLRWHDQLVGVAELARAAADGVAAVAQEVGVAVVTDWPAGPVPVCGDALRLTQVFDNLLGNALKFTGRGGQICLSVSPKLDQVRVEVRDTGIGIAPDSAARIFERLYQVDGTPMRQRGDIGLGLAICKLIVEVHGGQIGVESQLGAGSSFYFTLPLAAEI